MQWAHPADAWKGDKVVSAAAMSRPLNITAVGLGVRDELLLKSLLRIANEGTQDRWQFRDDMRADVALCTPSSASSLNASQVDDRSPFPRCIPVLQNGERAPVGTPAL